MCLVTYVCIEQHVCVCVCLFLIIFIVHHLPSILNSDAFISLYFIDHTCSSFIFGFFFHSTIFPLVLFDIYSFFIYVKSCFPDMCVPIVIQCIAYGMGLQWYERYQTKIGLHVCVCECALVIFQ